MAMHADWAATGLSGIHLLLENYLRRLADDQAAGKSVKTISADAFELSNGKPHKDRTFMYDERRLCKLAIRNMRNWARKTVTKPNAVEWHKHGELIEEYHARIGQADTDDEDVDGLDGDDSEPDEDDGEEGEDGDEEDDEADDENAADGKLACDNDDATGGEDEDNDDEYEPTEEDDEEEEEENEEEEEEAEVVDDDDDDGSKKSPEPEDEKDDDKFDEAARDGEEAGEEADDHAQAHDDTRKRTRDDAEVKSCDDAAVDHEAGVAPVKAAATKRMRVPKKP